MQRRLELILSVAVEVSYIEGRPDTAILGPLNVRSPVAAHADWALLPFADYAAALPLVAMAQGWHAELVPVAVRAVRDLEAMRDPPDDCEGSGVPPCPVCEGTGVAPGPLLHGSALEEIPHGADAVCACSAGRERAARVERAAEDEAERRAGCER